MGNSGLVHLRVTGKVGAVSRRAPGEEEDSRSFSAGGRFYIPACEGGRSLEMPNYATLRYGVEGRPNPLRVLLLPWGPGGLYALVSSLS